MKPDRWRKIDELFEAALEREPSARSAFLDKACGDDAELRREVQKMLNFDKQAEDFIKTDVFEVAARLITEPQSDGPKNSSGRRSGSTSNSIDDARFIPGDVLSDRYRIVGLLGRGGMGEVYRADDLKLKQPVALKFLPSSLTANGASLARFYKEVSVARQISHRHVCRVYDIGEYQGEHFISMEFVRGEGSYVYDADGRRYLDFIQGWAVNALGHCPKVIRDALVEQSKRLINVSPAYYNQPMRRLADLLAHLSGLDRVFFGNSGAEANECAIKLARKWGGLKRAGAYEFITFHGAFHGRAEDNKRYIGLFDIKGSAFCEQVDKHVNRFVLHCSDDNDVILGMWKQGLNNGSNTG